MNKDRRALRPIMKKHGKDGKKTIAKGKYEFREVVCHECGHRFMWEKSRRWQYAFLVDGKEDFRFKKAVCPKCGKEVVFRKTKKGRKYFGCEDYPSCDFMSWSKPVEKKCPKCGGYMVIKGNKIVCANEQCSYSENK